VIEAHLVAAPGSLGHCLIRSAIENDFKVAITAHGIHRARIARYGLYLLACAAAVRLGADGEE